MTPRRILVAGWLVFLVFAWPGYLTTESANQLVDAYVGNYSDWNAPTMSVIWRVLNHLVSGPLAMLVVQSGLFVAGAFGLLRRALPDRQAAVAAAAVLCFPPVAAPLAVIWRDAQLAGFLLAGAAALLSQRRAIRVGGLALVLIGITMRPTALIAALPLVLAFFVWSDRDGTWRRRLLAASAWLVVSVAAVGLDECAADNDTDLPELTRAQLDIIGILRFSDAKDDAAIYAELQRAGVPGVVAPEIRLDVRRLYRYTNRHHEIIQRPDAKDLRARQALLDARRELMLAHPADYLRHRSIQLRILLGLARAYEWRPLYYDFVELPEHRSVLRHRATHSWVQSQLIGVAEHTPAFFYHPYIYAFLALALVPLAIVRRERVALALLASGLLYEIALGFTLTLPEYRHSHWMIACTALATVMLVAQEVRRRRGAAAPSASPAETPARPPRGESPARASAA